MERPGFLLPVRAWFNGPGPGPGGGGGLCAGSGKGPMPCPLAACLAASLAVSILCASCSPALALPEARAEVLSVRPQAALAGVASVMVMEVRVSVDGALPVASFGLTARVSSVKRDYRKTGTWQERLPSGARAVVELEFPFSEEGEAYVEGSAVMESAWFE